MIISKPSIRVIKYLSSGGMAAIVEYLTFVLLHAVGLWLLAANALSFSCGLVVAFLLNKYWVFDHRTEGKKQFLQYVALAGINLALGSLVILLLVDHLHVAPLIGKFCTMIMIATWNYAILGKIVFKKRPEAES